MTPVEPAPAASVILVRPGSAEPIQVYMIRRHASMRFLGGFYAFPGGKVDPVDVEADSLSRCRGASPNTGGAPETTWDGLPATAFSVTAIRELFEEAGILLACDPGGRPVDVADGPTATLVDGWRRMLLAKEISLTAALAGAGWFYDLAPLCYLSHFITPRSSPIRFTARFFLASLPPGQVPSVCFEETSEGFWIGPRSAYDRFQSGGMAMAEPAEYALGYLAQFDDYEALWQSQADGRPKFHGIVDRIEFYGEGYDWATGTWKFNKPPWHP